MIIVIGRGHSGTRVMSHTLAQSGVFMGRCNDAGDLVPGDAMYAACQVFARQRDFKGFSDLIEQYLETILASKAEHKGFKIPEASLVYPWLVRMYPDAYYIHWVRDPRDCILGWHQTDNLGDFGLDFPEYENIHLQRIVSWQYQYSLVMNTPKPKHFIRVAFEDFVLYQASELERLERYLGFELATIPVNVDPVGRWRRNEPS